MEKCIFCKIAKGEIPSATLYEDEEFRVILVLPTKVMLSSCRRLITKICMIFRRKQQPML